MMNRITRNDFTQEIAAAIRGAMSELVRQAGEHDNISTLYVVDKNNAFAGAIDLKDLIIARENDRLEDVIRRGYPYVFAHEKVADCVDRLAEYEEDSLPVLSESGGIVGVLTAQDLVELALLGKEMRVGLLNGGCLGLMALAFLGVYIHFFKGYVWASAFLISGCVGVSLLVAMVISSLVGTLIPMLFHRIHIDPAVASGPLITTVNDLVAVVTYYGLALVFLIDVFRI